MNPKPLLLLDVDGVLNCAVSNPEGKRRGLMRLRLSSTQSGWTYTMHLRRDLVGPLRRAAETFDLAWATTWQYDANQPRFRGVFGLPVLPVATFDFGSTVSKVPGVLAFAADRPFVWIDDELDDGEVAWLDREHRLPHLVIPTEPAEGLTDDHLDRAASWAQALATVS